MTSVAGRAVRRDSRTASRYPLAYSSSAAPDVLGELGGVVGFRYGSSRRPLYSSCKVEAAVESEPAATVRRWRRPDACPSAAAVIAVRL